MSASLPPEPPRPGSSPLDDEDDDVPYVPRRGRWRRRVKPFGCRRVKDERDPAAHAWGPELEEVLDRAEGSGDSVRSSLGGSRLKALLITPPAEVSSSDERRLHACPERGGVRRVAMLGSCGSSIGVLCTTVAQLAGPDQTGVEVGMHHRLAERG